MFANRPRPRNHRPDRGLPLDHKLSSFLPFLALFERLSPLFATLTKKHRGTPTCAPPISQPLLEFSSQLVQLQALAEQNCCNRELAAAGGEGLAQDLAIAGGKRNPAQRGQRRSDIRRRRCPKIFA